MYVFMGLEPAIEYINNNNNIIIIIAAFIERHGVCGYSGACRNRVTV